MDSVLSTFMTTNKDSRAVLATMGCYALTAASVVAWVVYGIFQRHPKVQYKKQLQDKVESQPRPTASDTVLEVIRSRRSVFPKDYTGQLVSRDVLEQMLEAANWAPTHGRTEPWRFVVLSPDALQEMFSITDRVRATLDEASHAKKKVNGDPKAVFWPRATFIAICSLRQANPDKLQPEWEELAATSCAVQNLALTATALGVAGYWSSWMGVEVCNSKEMKAFLGIGAEDSCLGFYLVGSSERTSTYRAKRGNMSDKVTWK